jgi:hypothetical protein
MPVRIERTAKVVMEFDGQKTETNNDHILVKCDGPRCNKPGSPCLGVIEWDSSKPG